MYLIYKNSNSNSKYIDYENGINVTSNGALRVKLTYKICYTFINFVLAFRSAPWMQKFPPRREREEKKERGSCHLENICYSGENRVLRRNKWDLGYEWWLEWGDNTDEVVLHGRRKKASCFCSRVVDQTNES